MKYLGRFAGLFALTLSLGLFAAQPAAAAVILNNDNAVPIPGTFLLLAGGLAGLAWWHAKHPRA